MENTATHNRTPRSRRDDSAPLGIGVKAKPAPRVDLRSSLDPDPLPAFVRTEPGIRRNRSQPRGLTRPRPFRDDLQLFNDSAQAYYEMHLDSTRGHDFAKRVTASWGLIARGQDSLPYLMSMLTSRNADSREDAAGALGWLGAKSDTIVNALIAALDRESEDQPRDSIVLTLGALKSRAAIPALASLIRSDDTDADTRRCAVESLAGRVHSRPYGRTAERR